MAQGARMAKQKQESEYTATASILSWSISSPGFTYLSCDSGEIGQLLSLGIYEVEGGHPPSKLANKRVLLHTEA